MSDLHAVDRSSLLAIANARISAHEHYFPGLSVRDVQQKADVLVFSGDYFLDEQGLPTAKSMAVFNIFKALAIELSATYRLEE